MMSRNHFPTIMGELRRWRRIDKHERFVKGYMYADPDNIYHDGDVATIGPIVKWYESPTYFVIKTHFKAYRMYKEEEDGLQKGGS